MANHYHLLIEPQGQSFDRHASAKRDIHSEFQSPTQTGGPICFKGGSKRSWLKKSHNLLELCRYVVLNPVRVKGGTKNGSLEMEQLSGDSGISFVARVLKHRLVA